MITLTIAVLFSCLSSLSQAVPVQGKDFWNKLAQDDLTKQLNTEQNNKVAKNVILFVGDGMSIGTVTAARIFQGQQRRRSGEENFLSWERFENTGLAKTYNTDKQIPDSAGTATAFLCGVKGKYRTVGVDDNVITGDCSTVARAKVDSILTWALKAGKQAGLVTNMRITHATPAGAYAHVPIRYAENDVEMMESGLKHVEQCSDIPTQLIQNAADFKVVLGGGAQNFLPNGTSIACGKRKFYGKRNETSDDLIEQWKAKQSSKGRKHRFVCTNTELQQVADDDYVLGLFNENHLLYEDLRVSTRNDEPTLEQMTEKAIQLLANPNGFVLVVEAGNIDIAHHNNLASRALLDTLQLSNAVEKTLSITDKAETLTIVTADHSHSMMLHNYPMRGTPILGKVTDPEGNLVLANDGKPITTILYMSGPGSAMTQRHNVTDTDTLNATYVQQAFIPLDYSSHSGEDVAVYSQGPMSHLFVGVHEQNYIAHALAYAACIGDNKGHCQNNDGTVSNDPIKFAILVTIMTHLL